MSLFQTARKAVAVVARSCATGHRMPRRWRRQGVYEVRYCARCGFKESRWARPNATRRTKKRGPR